MLTYYHVYFSRRRIRQLLCSHQFNICFNQSNIVNSSQLYLSKYIFNCMNKYMIISKQILIFRKFMINLLFSFQTWMILSIIIMIFAEIQIRNYSFTLQKNIQKDSVFFRNYINRFWNRLIIIIHMMILIKHINDSEKWSSLHICIALLKNMQWDVQSVTYSNQNNISFMINYILFKHSHNFSLSWFLISLLSFSCWLTNTMQFLW